MLHRDDPGGLILITQPMHSWVSGQLARQWGNDQFGDFSPVEDVCLAAEQHDIGFLEWERAPTLDSRTGRPPDFMNMPKQLHVDIWSHTVEQMMPFSRYAALLVSLHVTSLCQRHPTSLPPGDAERRQGFLDAQDGVQHRLLGSLQSDPLYAQWSSRAVLERNRRLILTWDLMSLLICLASAGSHRVDQVPTAGSDRDLTLNIQPETPAQITVQPWPFRTPAVTLALEGRRLPQTFAAQDQMRSALQSAPAIAFQIRLTAG